MNAAVGFALLSLLFAGCIDVTFKLYSGKTRSRGMFIGGMGVVFLTLQTAMFLYQGQSPALDSTTLSWGIIAGIAVTASNILLVESLTHMDVSLGSLIYRLNTIGVVLLSFLFLGEDLGPFKIAGIGIGLVAVLLLYQPPSGSGQLVPLNFLIIVIAGAVLRALYGIFSKAGLNSGADLNTMILIIPICWLIGGPLYATFRENRVRMTWDKMKFCLIGGTFAFLIVSTLMAAIQRGDVSTLIPIANLGFVVALTISIGARMEVLTMRKGAAMVLAALSIFLLAQV